MTEQLRLASPLQLDSFVDGPGIRMVLWTQDVRITAQAVTIHRPTIQTQDSCTMCRN